LKHAQLAHVWAQQDPKRTSLRGSRMFFEGPVIYSHGPHWLIAQFVRNAQGATAVLLCTESRSTSTATHTRHVEAALQGLPHLILRVEQAAMRSHPDPSTVDRMVSNADTLMESAKRRRSATRRQWDLEGAQAVIDNARAFVAFYGFDYTIPSIFDGLSAIVAQARVARATAEIARLESQRAKDAAGFDAWRNGAAPYCPTSYSIDPTGSVYLRVRGDTVETSRGAAVPLASALRLYRLACAARTASADVNPARLPRVGEFVARAIRADGSVTIGCHTLSYERMTECASVIEARA